MPMIPEADLKGTIGDYSHQLSSFLNREDTNGVFLQQVHDMHQRIAHLNGD
jgi:hypothetical protein